ncbi:signal peptide peptidase SppA [Poriferisphaera sp. WC338]|uniref:signal peptide peptidase SppA n=1 Tax=Poriferisphaera sp. WC338 TaxID=3425129 RepID=UPI003D819F18
MSDSPSSPQSNDPGSAGRPPVSGQGAVTPPPMPAGYVPIPMGPPPKDRGWVRKFLGTLLLFSILANLYMGFLLSQALSSGPRESEYLPGTTEQRVVILPVMGTVDDKMYKFMRKSLLKLREDKPAAIVLRVNSGGGYVSSSDQIWHEIVKFKKETGIPIVASFGGVAASGAYYISAPADAIVIEQTGITGSIGVIAQGFTVNGLLEKVGVTPETITSTDSIDKDELSIFRKWTEKDREIMVGILDSAYEQFVKVVYEGRKKTEIDGKTHEMTEAQVRELATGAVFTSSEALANGLVDEVGYLDAAIKVAARKANMPADVEPRVTQMSQAQGGLLSLLGVKGPEMPKMDAEQIRSMLMEMSDTRLAYRLDLR